MTENLSNENNVNAYETPGQILRGRREELNLSLQDITKQIHLDISVLEAIEQDVNDGMPAATYVRGYLRSYAKIVGADADHIIALYNSDSPPSPPDILPEVKPPTQVSSSDKPVKAFTYLLTLALVLLLLIWYQSNFIVDTSATNEPENYNSEHVINGVDVTYDVIKHPDSWQSPKYTSEKQPAPEVLDSTSVNEDEMLELQTDDGEETLGLISIAGIENKTPLATTGAGPDSIDLTLTRDSWIEIHDANNERIFHDLALGGEHYSIKGSAPFKILFGFSPGVSMKFNGKDFDHSRYSNNGIARFKLPE